MIEKGQIYRCNVCGNVVKIVEVGGGDLLCCMSPMEQVESEDSNEE